MNITDIFWLYFVALTVMTLTVFIVRKKSFVKGIKDFISELI